MRLTGDTQIDIRALFCAYLKLLEQGGGEGGPADLEFQSTSSELQWRNVGDAAWETLVTYAELKSDTGFLTAITSLNVTDALGYTPIKPDGTTAQYIRGDGTKVTFPTIPTNTNQLTNGSGYITITSVPTNNNQLTNGAGYITSAGVPTNADYVDKTTNQTNIAGTKAWTALNTFSNGLTVSGGGLTVSGSGVVFTAIPTSAAAATLFPALFSGTMRTRTAAQVASDINVPITEVKTASGTGALTTINIAHGLPYTPVLVGVVANNDASNVQPLVTADSTNFIFKYAVAPANGSNNLSYNISYRR